LTGKGEGALCLVGLLRSRPELVTAAISRAASTGNAIHANTAAQLLASSLSAPFDLAVNWANQAIALSDGMQARLIRPLVACLARAVKTSTHLAALHAQSIDAKDDLFPTRIYIPLLQMHLDHQPSDEAWRRLARNLIEIALRLGIERDQIEWLASNHRPRIEATLLPQWLALARANGREGMLSKALHEAGLSRMSDERTPNPQVVESIRLTARPLPTTRRPPRSASVLNATTLGAFLAVLTLTVLTLTAVGKHYWPILSGESRIPERLSIVLSLAALLVYMTTEITLRAIRLRAHHLPYSRFSRWMICLILAMATSLAGWRLSEIVRRNISSSEQQSPPGKGTQVFLIDQSHARGDTGGTR
jgi:hypothetical protein